MLIKFAHEPPPVLGAVLGWLISTAAKAESVSAAKPGLKILRTVAASALAASETIPNE